VPCGPIYSIADIFKDPQYQAREAMVEVVDPRVGPVTIPAAMPRLSETPARFRHTGRPLGADTAAILAELLRLDSDALGLLRSKQVI
jgi:crotonobetainyl-CoA:carnitine CoA-transferase CaiB-like acyl-CoA transferase